MAVVIEEVLKMSFFVETRCTQLGDGLFDDGHFDKGLDELLQSKTIE